MTWTDTLNDQQRKEVAWARLYAGSYGHFTDGHSRLMLISLLAELLDQREGELQLARPAVEAWSRSAETTSHDGEMSALHAVLSGTDAPTPLEQLIAAARAAGAAGTWLIRGADQARLVYAMDDPPTPELRLDLTPPHEIIVLVRIPAGDSESESGIDFFGAESSE